jgi:hypothetical protein
MCTWRQHRQVCLVSLNSTMLACQPGQITRINWTNERENMDAENIVHMPGQQKLLPLSYFSFRSGHGNQIYRPSLPCEMCHTAALRTASPSQHYLQYRQIRFMLHQARVRARTCTPKHPFCQTHLSTEPRGRNSISAD